MKDRYQLLALIAVVGGVYLSVMYINPYGGKITLSEAVLQLSGSRGHFVLAFSYSELADFGMRLFPAFIFELYAGIMLYRHFCTASIYVFSRYPHRVKWYIGEVFHLSGAVCAFNLILLAVTMLTATIRYELEIDVAGIALIAYHLFIYSIWEYIMALLVNLFAIFWGSSTAYAIVVSIQLVCIVLLNLMNVFAGYDDGGLSYKIFLIWNPIAHLVLGWHTSSMKSLVPILISSYMQVDLNDSIILLLLLGTFITFVGAIIINKHDLLVSDLEAA
jgi:hypothetical protein